MHQVSFAEAEYRNKRRKTRRGKFLEQMDALVPWRRLEAKVEPFYFKAGRGSQSYPLQVMLRTHCMQLFYNLSDPTMEGSLYEIESLRHFAGLTLIDRIPRPDEITILNFRYLLEQHQLGRQLFEEINGHLRDHGMLLKRRQYRGATIIAAPSSTRN